MLTWRVAFDERAITPIAVIEVVYGGRNCVQELLYRFVYIRGWFYSWHCPERADAWTLSFLRFGISPLSLAKRLGGRGEPRSFVETRRTLFNAGAEERRRRRDALQVRLRRGGEGSQNPNCKP